MRHDFYYYQALKHSSAFNSHYTTSIQRVRHRFQNRQAGERERLAQKQTCAGTECAKMAAHFKYTTVLTTITSLCFQSHYTQRVKQTSQGQSSPQQLPATITSSLIPSLECMSN